MKELNWFQKLFIREVVGEITEKKFTYLALGNQEVTLYAITQDNKKYGAGEFGHKPMPCLGDKVIMHLKRGVHTAQIFYNDDYNDLSLPPKLRSWETIKNYEVLGKNEI